LQAPFEGEALVYRTEFSAGGTTLKLRNVTGVVSPGKLVSEEYIATRDAPEFLLVTVEAQKNADLPAHVPPPRSHVISRQPRPNL